MTNIEEWMREKYDAGAKGYRHDDELDVTGADHQQVANRLAEICESFSRPIKALDIGCGTGRYFHALRNVDHLVGIDVSDEMLTCARTPVKSDEISIPKIELQQCNFYNYDFPAHSFDFIYAIGVFGNGCPINPAVTKKFFNWLKPKGRLFFDVLDSANLPCRDRFKKWARSSLYLSLPAALQRRWDRRSGWPPIFLMSRSALKRSLHRAGFADVFIERHFTHLPLGSAWKHQCLSAKA